MLHGASWSGCKKLTKITYASENPTVQKGTDKSDESKRGMQEKKGKEHAAGDENFELHLY